MGRPAKKYGGDARKEYLDVAKKLFIKKGFANTYIREIGRLSGYNESNLYTYWKTKEDLFNEITACVSDMDLDSACQFPIEYAIMVEKMLSEEGTLITKLSELSPELLVSML